MSALQLDARGVIVPCAQCGQANRLGYERLDAAPRCAKCHAPLPAPAEPIDVGSDEEFDALTTRARLPVVVDFWAPWCGPCLMAAPEVAKVARRGARRWLVAKVNTDDLPGPAQRNRANSIPLFVLFHQGRELARQAGAMPAATLQQFVEQHLP
jgi:thioredoxin 2